MFAIRKQRKLALPCYQITVEPEISWGFKGTVDDLLRIYQIAYPALHEADSNITCTDSVLKLALTQEPQYVQGVSSAIWGRNEKGKPLSLKVTQPPKRELSRAE
ncbi:MAG: hypothetical protein WC340_12835 [Kiritimatiellia bacterium]